MAAKGLDASKNSADRDSEGARRLRGAMLIASGELGFAQVTRSELVARAGTDEAEFEAHFSSLRDCFERAYEAESGDLCEGILRAGAEGASWRQGLRNALVELGNYVAARPAISKGLLLQAQAAGREAGACRWRRLERLSRALDSARRAPECRHSPPPLTALFMVGTIEAAVVSMLMRDQPEGFLEMVPEVELIVTRAYFSE